MLSWALYDCANSAFATTVIAGFFPLYYNVLTADIPTVDAQFWFNLTLMLSSIFVSITAPLLGAIADSGGYRKKFLTIFTMLGILMSLSLVWTHAGMWWVGLLLYAFGSIGFYSANIFYDSLLVEVSDPSEYDLVSACGYALGYVGGGVLFAINVLMVTKPDWFGFANASTALMAAFISVGLWWGIFTVPLLMYVQEPKPPSQMGTTDTIKKGLAQLRLIFTDLRRMKTLSLFLIAYWFYIDGVGTVIKIAVFYGDRILGLPYEGLIIALLLTQFVAFPSTLFFGWLGNRIGARNGILIGLAVYLVAILYAWRWIDSSADFYGLAIAIGLVQGGVQSLSRSLYASFVPPGRIAEFFGLFNMIGKFAAIIGPLLLTITPSVIPNAGERDQILALVPLFIIGAGLLLKVNVADGIRTAQTSGGRL